jgi:hypothetical protein
MTETDRDCRWGPFAAVVGIAAASIAAAAYLVPPDLALGMIDARALRHGLGLAAMTMLAMAYVDALRSRCIRHYVSVALPVLALACLIPLVGVERADWGPRQGLGLGLFALGILLYAFLRFALHMLPTALRRGLTPLRTGLIGVAAASAWALYWAFGGRSETAAGEALALLGADFIGIGTGALLFAVLMRHRCGPAPVSPA